MKIKAHMDGFILMETIIAILLLGTILQGAFLFMTPLLKKKKALDLQQKHEHLLYALANYAAHQGRLPYATTQSNGKEVEGLHGGLTPYATLGLSKELSKMTYEIPNTHTSGISVSPLETFCRRVATTPLSIEAYTAQTSHDFVALRLNKKKWITRNHLVSFYGGASCTPFHQPLPHHAAPDVPRGFGR